jgi:hypothetical protein
VVCRGIEGGLEARVSKKSSGLATVPQVSVLNQITACMPMLPDCEATAFEAFRQLKCPIRLHVGSGRPATILFHSKCSIIVS